MNTPKGMVPVHAARFSLDAAHEMAYQTFELMQHAGKYVVKCLIKSTLPGTPDIELVLQYVCPLYGGECMSPDAEHGHYCTLTLLTADGVVGSWDGWHFDEKAPMDDDPRAAELPEGATFWKDGDCLGCTLYEALSSIYDPFMIQQSINHHHNSCQHETGSPAQEEEQS